MTFQTIIVDKRIRNGIKIPTVLKNGNGGFVLFCKKQTLKQNFKNHYKNYVLFRQ